ncbi:MAG TPA: hypothetical protein VG736_07795 [Vicinamibacterales bacterium]|nr:hypothetical protein [Vicinamibacterales bacterium]
MRHTACPARRATRSRPVEDHALTPRRRHDLSQPEPASCVNHAGKTRSPACGPVKLHTTYHVTADRAVHLAHDDP